MKDFQRLWWARVALILFGGVGLLIAVASVTTRSTLLPFLLVKVLGWSPLIAVGGLVLVSYFWHRHVAAIIARQRAKGRMTA